MRPIGLVLALAVLSHAPACVTKKVKKALETETRASLSVSGDAEVLAALGNLSTLYKVGVTVETVEAGIRILRIVGAYAEVIDAIQWLLLQNLKLLANDELSRSLLSIAIAAMK